MRRSLSMREFIRQNRAELDVAILRALNYGREQYPAEVRLNDDDRRQWILNEESLYRWARSEGVRI